MQENVRHPSVHGQQWFHLLVKIGVSRVGVAGVAAGHGAVATDAVFVKVTARIVEGEARRRLCTGRQSLSLPVLRYTSSST